MGLSGQGYIVAQPAVPSSLLGTGQEIGEKGFTRTERNVSNLSSLCGRKKRELVWIILIFNLVHAGKLIHMDMLRQDTCLYTNTGALRIVI